MPALAGLDGADAPALAPSPAAAVAGPIWISAEPSVQPLAIPAPLIPTAITSPAPPTHSDAVADGLDTAKPIVAVFEPLALTEPGTEAPALALVEPLIPAPIDAGASDAVTAVLTLVEPLLSAPMDADDGELPPETLTPALAPVPADPCPPTEIDGNGSVPTDAVPPADPVMGKDSPMPTVPIGPP